MGLQVVVMGVSGAGKSTVGAALARHLGVDFADGDEFHPAANIAKMSSGGALTDADRVPWLGAIAAWLAEHERDGAVVACSALRRAYRDALREGAPNCWFLLLAGSRELMAQRVSGRRGHFMPASLVDSQFEVLDAPGDDERVVTLDAGLPPDVLVEAFTQSVAR